MEAIAAVAIVLLALACPLGMLAIGGIAWLVARARGEKKELSMGCMPGHGQSHGAAGAEPGDAALREEVSRLRREVADLRAQAAVEERVHAEGGS
jgi:ribosomal protein L19E